jgi:hypothetical protein
LGKGVDQSARKAVLGAPLVTYVLGESPVGIYSMRQVNKADRHERHQQTAS